jgi:hypothetical protein
MISTRKSPQFRSNDQGPAAPGNASVIASRLDALGQRWAMDAKMALADLNESLGAVMSGTAQQPEELVVVQKSGKALRSGVGQSDSIDVSDLEPQEILALSLRPIRGKELTQVTERLQAASQDSALGASMYADLVAILANCATTHDYDGQMKAIAQFDRDAAVRGGIVGRIVKQSVADGHAEYMVTAVSADRVRVQHLDAVDGYSIQQWGHDAWIDRSMAEKNTQYQDSMRRLFAKPR